MTKLEELQNLAKEAGLNMYDVLREAKIPKDTIINWRRKEPKSFETEKKIRIAIEQLKNEKHSTDSEGNRS